MFSTDLQKFFTVLFHEFCFTISVGFKNEVVMDEVQSKFKLGSFTEFVFSLALNSFSDCIWIFNSIHLHFKHSFAFGN